MIFVPRQSSPIDFQLCLKTAVPQACDDWWDPPLFQFTPVRVTADIFRLFDLVQNLTRECKTTAKCGRGDQRRLGPAIILHQSHLLVLWSRTCGQLQRDDKITNGWALSGSFDYLERLGRLIDFKVTSAWSVISALNEGKPDWENQLNVLDFLCRKNQKNLTSYGKPIKVKSLNIMAILRDWSKLQVMKSDNYPRKQVIMIPIRRWTPKEHKLFLEALIIQLLLLG